MNKTNFPKLKVLKLSGNRRNDTTGELNTENREELTGGELGMYQNLTTDRQAFIDLLKWDALEELSLSSNSSKAPCRPTKRWPPPDS